MEVIVKHRRFGTGTIDKIDFSTDKVVTVLFDDRKFRRVHKSCLTKIRDKHALIDE